MTKYILLFPIFFILFFQISVLSKAQNQVFQSYFEKSGYLETPRYNEVARYSKLLDSLSGIIRYTSFGKTPQGRDLQLLIADKNGNFTPESVRKSDHLVVLIQACIHAGECEGKDAGLMLFRDFISKKEILKLLDHCTILFIPIYNTDGHERFGAYNRINQNGPKEMGWRTNATNLNLNRDYLKADAPETKCWLHLFNNWLPDFFMDLHTTDGADYQYTLTYGLEIFGNTDSNLTQWLKTNYLQGITTKLAKRKQDIIPYVMFRDWSDPRSGLYASVSNPMLSTGYVAIQNRPGILVETHMLKDYKTRVFAVYDMLVSTLEVLNNEYKTLLALNNLADQYCSSKELLKKTFPLRFKTADDSTIIDFKGFKYDTIRSDITNAVYIKYSHIPVTYKIPWFNYVKPTVGVMLPLAYIVPSQWTEVIERLDNHGIKSDILSGEMKIMVHSYKFSHIKWRQKCYEGRNTVSFDVRDTITEMIYPAGSRVIKMDQRTARVIAHILEPEGPDSYVYWGFFSTIFEQKEYSEEYVMEQYAAKMLLENPGLKKEFERRRREDKDFPKDQGEILNWFYSQSPYWDHKLDIYPVGRIFDNAVLNSLPLIKSEKK